MSFRPLPLLRLLCALVALLATASAMAAAITLGPGDGPLAIAAQVEVLEDPGGKLRLADVVAGPAAGGFRPAASGDGDINFGYSASAFWLRFTVLPAGGQDGDWLLEVAYPSLDRIELHDPAGVRVTGDLLPFAQRPIVHRNFVFPLRLQPGQAQTLYLRVSSAGSLTVPLRLWPAESFARHNQQTYASFSIYYGMLLALMLYNLLLYFSLRDSNYLTYVAFVATMAVAQLSHNGFGNQFVWPDWPAWGNVALPIGFAATGFFGALFTRGFLATAQRTPRLDRLILLLTAAFALAGLSPAIVAYRMAAILVSLTGAAFSVIAVATAITCWRQGQAGARYFLIAWFLLLAGVAMLAGRNLGWLPTTWLTTYAMQVGSALEMLLLSFALADRINTLRREKEFAQAAALTAQEQAMETLMGYERELEARVLARTAELQAANARLQENERLLQDMAHHDPLTGLANRLLLDARLEHAIQHCRRGGQQLAVLLVDLDHFKPINDHHGHAIGDRLLAEVARRLRIAVREADTVARLGGDEFVIVLGGLRAAEDAALVAEKLIASLAEPVHLGALELQVGASIGIASHRPGTSQGELLRQADTAMYAAKAAGGACYRLCPDPAGVA